MLLLSLQQLSASRGITTEHWTHERFRQLEQNSIAEPGPFWGMYFEECNQEEVITLNEIPLYSPGRARACLEGALQVWDNVPASPYLLTPSRQWLMVVPGRHQTERYTLYLAASFPYTDRTLEHLCKELSLDRKAGEACWEGEQLRAILRHALALVLAVDELHCAGLVHRGVRAQEVAVYRDGSVRLAGADRCVEAGAWTGRSGRGDDLSDSAPLMCAPEVVAMNAPRAHWAQDSWSVGMVLWTMAVGYEDHPSIESDALQRLHDRGLSDDRCMVSANVQLGIAWPSSLMKFPSGVLTALHGLLHTRADKRWDMARVLRCGLFRAGDEEVAGDGHASARLVSLDVGSSLMPTRIRRLTACLDGDDGGSSTGSRASSASGGGADSTGADGAAAGPSSPGSPSSPSSISSLLTNAAKAAFGYGFADAPGYGSRSAFSFITHASPLALQEQAAAAAEAEALSPPKPAQLPTPGVTGSTARRLRSWAEASLDAGASNAAGLCTVRPTRANNNNGSSRGTHSSFSPLACSVLARQARRAEEERVAAAAAASRPPAYDDSAFCAQAAPAQQQQQLSARTRSLSHRGDHQAPAAAATAASADQEERGFVIVPLGDALPFDSPAVGIDGPASARPQTPAPSAVCGATPPYPCTEGEGDLVVEVSSLSLDGCDTPDAADNRGGRGGAILSIDVEEPAQGSSSSSCSETESSSEEEPEEEAEGEKAGTVVVVVPTKVAKRPPPGFPLPSPRKLAEAAGTPWQRLLASARKGSEGGKQQGAGEEALPAAAAAADGPVPQQGAAARGSSEGGAYATAVVQVCQAAGGQGAGKSRSFTCGQEASAPADGAPGVHAVAQAMMA